MNIPLRFEFLLLAIAGFVGWVGQKTYDALVDPVRFTYDEKLAGQDSLYSLRLAEAIYFYRHDVAQEIALFATRPDAEKAALQDSAYIITYAENYLFPEKYDLKDMCDSARRYGDRYVILQEKGARENFLAADTTDLRALIAYKDEHLSRDGVHNLPLYVYFSSTDNGWTHRDPDDQVWGISLSVSALSDYARSVAYALLRHEIGHATEASHEDDVMPYDLHGHEENITDASVKGKLSDEGYCDFRAAEKDVDAKTLIGLMCFMSRDRIGRADFDALLALPREGAVPLLAKRLFEENKHQIRSLSTHPPTLYRFVTMADQIGVDIAQIPALLRKKDGTAPR